MKKQEFIKLANIIITEKKRLEEANKHLFELCDKKFTYAPRLNNDMLDEELGNNSFSWWLYEDVKKEVEYKGKTYCVETIEQLWDFEKME
jgi:hypothetical protein